jgi:DNA-binding transcriptional MerR regulator
MSVTALDTLQVVKKLKAAGFSEEQAEAVTQVVRDSQNIDLSNLATKSDLSSGLSELRSELKAEIAELRGELKAEIAELRSDTKAEFADVRSESRTEFAKIRTEIADTKVEIIKWVIGIGIAQAGLVFAMLRFMH